MSATPTVEALLGEGGVADRVLPGWEARPEQIRMAEAVEAKLAEGGVAIVEAPTGVGKTLAYLVPAALSGRRVIISTNTKTLQDQIADKDLVRLGAILGAAGYTLARASADDLAPHDPQRVRYALMKGRSNYLCIDRLHAKTRQATFDFDDYDLMREIREWAATTERGDRSELVGLPERAPVWDGIDARSETCKGKRCEHYDACWVVRMRREAEHAELIIVNHHLLLADLSLQAAQMLSNDGRTFGEIIPPADALIVDEAHALEEIATDYFGGSISTKKVDRLVADLTGFASSRDARLATRLVAATARVGASTSRVFSALPRSDGRVRAKNGDAPFAPALRVLPEAERDLDEVVQLVDDAAAYDAGAEALSRRTREVADALGFVLRAEDDDYVYWSERKNKAVTLGASPIDVASLLSRFLFERFGAVALTSATLSTGGGDTRFFSRAVGAPEDADNLVLGSPFDFRRQSLLYLPHDAPEGNARDATESGARIAKRVIDAVGGGALYLFTSYRAMHAAHRFLDGQLGYPVLMQGEKPKRELIAHFVEQAPAVLFATATFWEGVDVPGAALQLVIVDRLPFDPPNDPLAVARGERLEALGKSAFNAYFVPRAILRLKQGFGRLVRTKADRGVVAILDRRVSTRGYGRRFLSALPDVRRVSHLEDLEQWWAHPAETEDLP